MNAPKVYTLADLESWKPESAPLRLAVIGDPVAHSLSPAMQNAALTAAGIRAQYGLLHVPSADLAQTLKALARAGFLGVNLTIPHKAAALPLMDELDPWAAKLGAINTVRVEPDGRLRGFNTDGPGFEAAVREWGTKLSDLRVLILGAGGGAGRALAIQSLQAGAPQVTLINRTDERAKALAHQIADPTRAVTMDWRDRDKAAQAADLIVNATALGLINDDSPLSTDAINSRHLIFDTVYRAGSATSLVKAAITKNARVIDGRALLLHQGALAFEIWFGQPARMEAIREALYPAC